VLLFFNLKRSLASVTIRFFFSAEKKRQLIEVCAEMAAASRFFIMDMVPREYDHRRFGYASMAAINHATMYDISVVPNDMGLLIDECAEGNMSLLVFHRLLEAYPHIFDDDPALAFTAAVSIGYRGVVCGMQITLANISRRLGYDPAQIVSTYVLACARMELNAMSGPAADNDFQVAKKALWKALDSLGEIDGTRVAMQRKFVCEVARSIGGTLYRIDTTVIRHLYNYTHTWLRLKGAKGKHTQHPYLRPPCGGDRGRAIRSVKVLLDRVRQGNLEDFCKLLETGIDPVWCKHTPEGATLITAILHSGPKKMEFLAHLSTHYSFEAMCKHKDTRGKTALQLFRQDTPILHSAQDVAINNVLTPNTTRAAALAFCYDTSAHGSYVNCIGEDSLKIIGRYLVAPADPGFWDAQNDALADRPIWTRNWIDTNVFGPDLGVSRFAARFASNTQLDAEGLADDLLQLVTDQMTSTGSASAAAAAAAAAVCPPAQMQQLRQQFVSVLHARLELGNATPRISPGKQEEESGASATASASAVIDEPPTKKRSAMRKKDRESKKSRKG